MKEPLKAIEGRTGALSAPSKMPCHGYSTPASACHTGSRLAKVPGSVCAGCYALKGRYPFPAVQNALAKRLKAIESVQWTSDMVELIARKEKSGFFRWHDSGDLQSVQHLFAICEIARCLPQIRFWLPTREYGIVSQYLEIGDIPDNLTIRLSAFKIDGPAPASIAKRLGVQTSTVVTDKSEVTCPSSKQGNKCLECRNCWDKSIGNIAYGKH